MPTWPNNYTCACTSSSTAHLGEFKKGPYSWRLFFKCAHFGAVWSHLETPVGPLTQTLVKSYVAPTTHFTGIFLSCYYHASSIPVIIERDRDTSHLKIGLNVRSLTSKAIIVNELITDHNLDVIGLTETWLKPDEFTVLIRPHLLATLVTISPLHSRTVC